MTPKKYKTEVRDHGRVCTCCGIFQPWENFYFYKNQNRYNAECDACRLAKRRTSAQTREAKQKRKNYLIINREKIREQGRKREKTEKRKLNKRKNNQKRYEKNREKIIKENKKYRRERYTIGVRVCLRNDTQKVGKLIGENMLRKGVLVKWQGVPTPVRILQKYIKNLPEKNYLEF